jgi:endonuclease/exonuclease/phosphatase family metal-dependent hydrolase
VAKQALKVVQLNVCRDTRTALDFVIDNKDSHDVFCLQEVLKPGHRMLTREFRYHYWRGMTRVKVGEQWIESGVGIYTNLAFHRKYSHYYVGSDIRMENLDDAPGDYLYERIEATKNRILLGGDFIVGRKVYRIFTTHFDWVSDGKPSVQQRRSAEKVLKHLRKADHFVICADFNFPRGGEIWQEFVASGLIYSVPNSIEWTLDPGVHKLGERVKDLKIMIDHIFCTGDYSVKDVQARYGLSDHCALTFTVI